jgi:hypothetical protein
MQASPDEEIPEMFESLASCFAFRCSASLNMTVAIVEMNFPALFGTCRSSNL